MDIVAADRLEWKRDPFKLVVEGNVVISAVRRKSLTSSVVMFASIGDRLWGRGVTDCLGHVALLACVFKQLAILKPQLKIGVAGVFIANEENSTISGVGIDMLAEHGELDYLKHAPLFWIDSANFGPTIGTGGRLEWQLTGVGKKFHSGFPLQGINGIELASEALKYVIIQSSLARLSIHETQLSMYVYG
jgi:acetylornithine deacetylase/succinyl-diaminopimelate desuccinylase-like protein